MMNEIFNYFISFYNNYSINNTDLLSTEFNSNSYILLINNCSLLLTLNKLYNSDDNSKFDNFDKQIYTDTYTKTIDTVTDIIETFNSNSSKLLISTQQERNTYTSYLGRFAQLGYSPDEYSHGVFMNKFITYIIDNLPSDKSDQIIRVIENIYNDDSKELIKNNDIYYNTGLVSLLYLQNLDFLKNKSLSNDKTNYNFNIFNIINKYIGNSLFQSKGVYFTDINLYTGKLDNLKLQKIALDITENITEKQNAITEYKISDMYEKIRYLHKTIIDNNLDLKNYKELDEKKIDELKNDKFRLLEYLHKTYDDAITELNAANPYTGGILYNNEYTFGIYRFFIPVIIIVILFIIIIRLLYVNNRKSNRFYIH